MLRAAGGQGSVGGLRGHEAQREGRTLTPNSAARRAQPSPPLPPPITSSPKFLAALAIARVANWSGEVGMGETWVVKVERRRETRRGAGAVIEGQGGEVAQAQGQALVRRSAVRRLGGPLVKPVGAALTATSDNSESGPGAGRRKRAPEPWRDMFLQAQGPGRGLERQSGQEGYASARPRTKETGTADTRVRPRQSLVPARLPAWSEAWLLGAQRKAGWAVEAAAGQEKESGGRGDEERKRNFFFLLSD